MQKQMIRFECPVSPTSEKHQMKSSNNGLKKKKKENKIIRGGSRTKLQPISRMQRSVHFAEKKFRLMAYIHRV